MQAVGIYIDRLTVLRGLLVRDVASHAGVHPTYVSRLVSGSLKHPSAEVLHALVEAVGGSWEDIGILIDSCATRAEAEALADAWYMSLRPEGQQRLRAAVEEFSDLDRLRHALRQRR